MEEIWKPVIGYENYYEVSNFGRVRRIQTGRILKGSTDYDGYSLVGLYLNQKVRMFRRHRLVAQAFIPNPDNKSEVNHIDGDKLNNFVGNLEWVSCQENIQHAWRTGLRDEVGKKISKANKGRHGATVGRIAITNDVVSFFIPPEDFLEWESKGYRRGRNKYQHLRVNEGKGL